jgi:mannose-6-phosphate isomerase-like protein (cupin superfamily)
VTAPHDSGTISDSIRLVEVNSLPRSLPPGHWGVATASIVETDAVSSVTFQACEMQPGGGAEMHSHSAAGQVLLVLQGQLDVTHVGGSKVSVFADQALVIPAGRPHAVTNDGARIARYLVLTLTS